MGKVITYLAHISVSPSLVSYELVRMRDPHETIVRNVLIFPADGSEPRISPMTFSEAGAKSNPRGLYTVNVDLQSLYGNRNMHATRSHGWDMMNQETEVTNGDYILFHNISPKLPVNITMARIVGVDPKRPGQRPLWRGDVVVVKTSEWPEPIPMSAGAHMDYLDVPPQALKPIISILIPAWYKSDQWRDLLENEREFSTFSLSSGLRD